MPGPLSSSKNGSVIPANGEYTLKESEISKVNKSCGAFGDALISFRFRRTTFFNGTLPWTCQLIKYF